MSSNYDCSCIIPPFFNSVVVNCGVTISENNTYFESDGDEKSHCSIKVCKASEKIVQVIDFNDILKHFTLCFPIFVELICNYHTTNVE